MSTTARAIKVRRSRAPYFLLLPGLAYLVFFYVVPTFSMLSLSLQEGTVERGFTFTWRFQTYLEVIQRYDTQLIRSLIYGLVVTIVCLLISYPLAYTIAFHAGRWKNALLFVVVLPFFVSFVIRTLAWRQILGDEGFVLGPLKDVGILADGFHLLATPFAVIGGLVYNFLPFMTLPLYVALEKMDRNVLDAAYDLGAGRVTTFRTVTFPLSLPGIVAGSLLTFIPSVGDFVNATLLGGVNTTMIGNVIQRQYLTTNNYPGASAISFILMAMILVMVLVYARVSGTEELTG